ncbi:CD1845 family protein [Ruminococcaceae bacterium OttesenSCG-928-L11]|nr:CD1845 family protein [Ruminococcaceae bacterium OttesenSCG-928-L11]
MRFLLKVLTLPVTVALSISVLALSFLVSCAGSALKLLCFPAFLLGAGIAIMTDPVAGGLILAGAFLISPFGLPLVAEWLLDRMADLNFALREFIVS